MRFIRLPNFVSLAVLVCLVSGIAACSSPPPTPTPTPRQTPTPIPTETPTLEPTATPTATPSPVPTDPPVAEPTATPTFTPTPVPDNTIRSEPTATHTPDPNIIGVVGAIACDSDDFHTVVRHVYAWRNVQEGLEPFYAVATEIGYSKEDVETLTRDWCRENLNYQVFCEETDIQNVVKYLFLTFKDTAEWDVLDKAHQTVTDHQGLFSIGVNLAEGLIRSECKRMLS